MIKLQGLVGYWPFDEGSGTIVKDYSGNGNNGTLCNGSTCGVQGPTWTTGKVGGALSFDGVDDYVYIPYSLSLNLPRNNESVFLWIKHNSNYVLFQSSSWNRRLFATVWTFYDASNQHYNVNAGSPNDNTYHFVGYTVVNNTVKTYKDGDFVASASRSVNAVGPASSYWWLGRVCSGSSCSLYYSGLIDEVRIYNRALSDSEIKALYDATQ